MLKKETEKKIQAGDATVDRIKKIIDQIRPSLQMDGGDVQFVDFNAESGLLKVELIGHCAHCPMSTVTLKQGIEEEVRRLVPEVKEVRSVGM